MSVTTTMLDYLTNVARWLIDGDEDEDERLREERDRMWATLTPDEREHLNGLVGSIFGEWL